MTGIKFKFGPMEVAYLHAPNTPQRKPKGGPKPKTPPQSAEKAKPRPAAVKPGFFAWTMMATMLWVLGYAGWWVFTGRMLQEEAKPGFATRLYRAATDPLPPQKPAPQTAGLEAKVDWNLPDLGLAPKPEKPVSPPSVAPPPSALPPPSTVPPPWRPGLAPKADLFLPKGFPAFREQPAFDFAPDRNPREMPSWQPTAARRALRARIERLIEDHPGEWVSVIVNLGTGYCHCPRCCGDSGKACLRGVPHKTIPDVGRDAHLWDGVAADLTVFPAGAILAVPGLGYRIVDDDGSALRVRANRGILQLDFRHPTHEEAAKFLRRNFRVKMWVPPASPPRREVD
jgi:3D (Asp-Asp-Asp) domain-containing protein